MNTYELLQCDTCKKKSKRLILKNYGQINKCNLTLACRGKLIKLHESNVSSNTETINTIIGNSNGVIEKLKVEKKITVLNGPNHIALSVSQTPSDLLTFQYTLREIKFDNKQFIEYRYLVPAQNSTIISGKDHSSTQKVLSFDSDIELSIFVNGDPLTNSQYDRSIDNQISISNVFTLATNEVKIYAYKFTIYDEVQLTFNRVDSSNTCAWGNVKSIKK